MKLAGPITRHFTTSTAVQKSERVATGPSTLSSTKELHAHLIRTHLHNDPSSYISASEKPGEAIHMSHNMYLQGLGGNPKLFDGMWERDLVSWNSLICGYSQCNRFNEVLGLFEAMQAANVWADAVTMVKVILACNYLGERKFADSVVKRDLANLAREVFDRMGERNIVSWNAMITGYAKVGNLVDARKLFNEMPKRNVVSWTSMITCYSQANQHSEAVSLFQEMMAANVRPDEIAVASVLSACAHVGSLDVGETVHHYIKTHGVKVDVYVGNALIDMYCKCGVVEKAMEVFQWMEKKDSVSWTSVISGLAVNGFADSALECFSRMLREELKHYGCVVDLLSRSGKLDKASEFVQTMPVGPGVVVWRILLSACKIHGNAALAEIVTAKLVELDPSNSGITFSHRVLTQVQIDGMML
ncbi:hypothetical protein ACFXTN_001897 [Malus domestica]